MNALTDPGRRPPGYAAIYCGHCGQFISWCNPPRPPVPTRCQHCAREEATNPNHQEGSNTMSEATKRCARCGTDAPPQEAAAFHQWEAIDPNGTAVVCPDCITPEEQQALDTLDMDTLDQLDRLGAPRPSDR